MSRYTFAGQLPRYRLVVGWDLALRSYFGQVEDLAWETDGAVIDEDASIGDGPDEGLLVWIGADRIVEEIAEVQAALAPYGTIPDDILAKL